MLPRPSDPPIIVTPPPTTTPPPTKPPDTTTTPPPVKPGVGMGVPTGKIPDYPVLKIAYGRGGDWSKVTRHNEHHVKYGNLYGVRPSMLEAMEVVESGGESIPNGNGFPNFGVMQLTHHLPGQPDTDWETIGKTLGVDFRSPEGQIAIAAYRLGGHYNNEPGTPEEIFLKHYYPTECLDCPGQDGHTPRQYLADMKVLEGIINAAPGGETKPPPKPKPLPTTADILRLMTGGSSGAYVSFGFNEYNTQATSPIYTYGAGHGLPAGGYYHPGIDVWTPDETPIHAIFAGEVTCVGEQGRDIWGQGCGYFVDDQHGVGNITILTDTLVVISGKQYRLKMTYGHMSSATVRLGQKVNQGEQIGRSGVGFQWPHVHLDVVIEAPELNNPQIWFNGGAYHLVSPIPTIVNGIVGNDVTVEPPPELMKFKFLESPNFMSRQGRPILAIVYHIADSMSLEGTISWLRQRGSDASSHWVIDVTGEAYQLIGSAQAAFTNGALLNPRQDIPWLASMPKGDNANWYTLTLEHIGTPNSGITPEQFASSANITRYYLPKYRTINRDRSGMMRHSDFASIKNAPYAPDPTGKIDRSYCPGPKFPLRELMLEVGADPNRMSV